MKNVNINGKKYILAVNYKNNEKLRNSFNFLTDKIYGFNFEQWYQNGYWQEQYIPYSLIDKNKIVANVSVSLMDFLIKGEKKRYIQIGTVMTDIEYRHQDLSRFLLEKVLTDYENKCDLFYLFANDSVLNFYPKFGFVPQNEYQYSKEIIKKENNLTIRKLNMDNKNDRNFLFDTVSNSTPFSDVAMINNSSLIMFYCISFMKNNIYYIEDYNTIAIVEYIDERLKLYDIFSKSAFSLDDIIDALSTAETKKVILGFTPKEKKLFEINLLKKENTTLFVKPIKENIFTNGRFPVLSHT